MNRKHGLYAGLKRGTPEWRERWRLYSKHARETGKWKNYSRNANAPIICEICGLSEKQGADFFRITYSLGGVFV